MPNEVEQRLREIEEQLRLAKPPYDLIPCDEPDCDRAFIGVRGDAAGADCDCGGFRREDAELMTQAPENLRFLLAVLREREEENRRLREALEEIRDICEYRGEDHHARAAKAELAYSTASAALAQQIDAELGGEAAADPLEEENRRLRERVAELEHIETGLRRLIEELKPRV